MHWYIPKTLLPTANPIEWISLLNREHENLKGKTPEECKEIYLKIVRKQPFYGAALFNVEVIYPISLSLSFYLLVSLVVVSNIVLIRYVLLATTRSCGCMVILNSKRIVARTPLFQCKLSYLPINIYLLRAILPSFPSRVISEPVYSFGYDISIIGSIVLLGVCSNIQLVC